MTEPTPLDALALDAILDCDDDSYGLWELDWRCPQHANVATWHAAVKRVLLDMVDEQALLDAHSPGRLEFLWEGNGTPRDTSVSPEDAAVMIADDAFWDTPGTDGHLRFMALGAIPEPTDA